MAESNKMYINFKDATLLQRFDDLFPTRNSEQNISFLLDAYEERNTLQQQLARLQTEANTLQEQNQRLAETNQNLTEDLQKIADERQTDAETCQNNAEQVQKLTEQLQKLAEDRQSLAEQVQNLTEKCQGLIAQQDNQNTIQVDCPDWVRTLLNETAERLTAKYNKPVSPDMILRDMFVRYTVERWNQWFYPFVLNDHDIEQLTGYTIHSIKKSLKQ